MGRGCGRGCGGGEGAGHNICETVIADNLKLGRHLMSNIVLLCNLLDKLGWQLVMLRLLT